MQQQIDPIQICIVRLTCEALGSLWRTLFARSRLNASSARRWTFVDHPRWADLDGNDGATQTIVVQVAGRAPLQ
jgi:hypothetical protein